MSNIFYLHYTTGIFIRGHQRMLKMFRLTQATKKICHLDCLLCPIKDETFQKARERGGMEVRKIRKINRNLIAFYITIAL